MRTTSTQNRFQFLSILIAAAVIVGCGSKSEPEGSRIPSSATFTGTYPIKVVATTGMVSDIVRTVGGEHVSVDQICGTGVDPHTYQATRDDVQTIMSGDMVFYSGLMLEGKMADTLIKVGRAKPVFAVTEMIDGSLLLNDESDHSDPHVWNDVSAWAKCVKAVENALIDFDPDNADVYAKNASALREQLDELHQYGLKSLATIPEESRVLVTSHDAFSYFGRAYGLDVQGIQGLSTDSEAGVQRINELVDMLVEKNVKAVFIESSVSRKNIDALIEGAKSRGHNVIVGGELFSDAMGEEGTYEGTYLGMLDHNITTVTRALGGEADTKGFGGKLGSSAD